MKVIRKRNIVNLSKIYLKALKYMESMAMMKQEIGKKSALSCQSIIVCYFAV